MVAMASTGSGSGSGNGRGGGSMEGIRASLWMVLLVVGGLLVAVGADAQGTTTAGFYSRSCPKAEAIVKAVVQTRFARDPTITAALLRLHFHDALAGADASLLLDSTQTTIAEKDIGPNLSVRGYDLIEAVKSALEAACPGIVSCADIIALATRDAVALSGGPSYVVPTGRKDSLRSIVEDAFILPGPQVPVSAIVNQFLRKGLNMEDLVALLGAHTVGVSHCSFFSDRAYDFEGTGVPDRNLNRILLAKLLKICPDPSSLINDDPNVALDQSTPTRFDSSFFAEIKKGNGILLIDDALTRDPSTLGFVNKFLNPAAFFQSFARAMVKMGNIKVLTGNQGQIRRKCNLVNPPWIKKPTPKPPTRKSPTGKPPIRKSSTPKPPTHKPTTHKPPTRKPPTRKPTSHKPPTKRPTLTPPKKTPAKRAPIPRSKPPPPSRPKTNAFK